MNENGKKPQQLPEIPSVELLEAELNRSKYQKRFRSVLLSTFFSLLVVAAIAVIVAVLVMPILQITGTSMTDTLNDGDLVVTLKSKQYKTGDVIGFYINNGILVKRVIATSGDWVDIDPDGTVHVNGTPLER